MHISVQKQMFLMSLYFGENAQLAVYCTFLFKEIVHLLHFIREITKSGEQIIFMHIRVLLNGK